MVAILFLRMATPGRTQSKVTTSQLSNLSSRRAISLRSSTKKQSYCSGIRPLMRSTSLKSLLMKQKRKTSTFVPTYVQKETQSKFLMLDFTISYQNYDNLIDMFHN